MKEYEILISYLRASNWNEDGSPSDDDTYYKIIKVKANSKEEALKNVESFVFDSEDWCGIENDYVEDTFDIVQMLSEVGHSIN